MNWTDALDLIVEQTGHARYRWLCSEDNPDASRREAYRALMIRQAAGEPEPSSDDDAQLRAHVARHGCGGC